MGAFQIVACVKIPQGCKLCALCGFLEFFVVKSTFETVPCPHMRIENESYSYNLCDSWIESLNL
jgi:hypothetical protein